MEARKKMKMLISTVSTTIILEAHAENKTKKIRLRKKQKKMSLLIDDIINIFYLKNARESTNSWVQEYIKIRI